ncbi:S8 family serine peptidase [Schinkia azotoformans]|uniref:Peptidase S8 and S53 subtilisin kexin sedolisin n=1 Tax=Schinkia azotoformans LMG 9581 TaxID=1131731 RepID=K6CWU2_SCHAZ|nr:S8 family serine peptidase [Schinkia azotoformans]EKN64697.1 peptidase S8 and S53 subtilisin kexin sedolisin [Schinkia azotoformans LMG 9581]MEC1639892.1 S8 family serine peptidase [Schinkia azotoformans]MEC1719722.1 S8 family serine peptidase [Schinkia azotoformans]MEC1947289.1 S8 family serine peptidase [Schinkia azotoformans]MED4412710.1 S8 family serine peptidase [Schinkia azotoformans]
MTDANIIKPINVHKINTSYTGKGVTVAVIDSGINPYHSHVNGVEGGIQIRVNREQYIEYHHDYRDRLGHGTAVAAAIRGVAKEADLYGVKIFDDKLMTYPSILAEAIEWSIENHVQIIHLSLGLTQDHAGVKDACKAAIENNITIVAAMDRERGMIYPGSYPDVFHVQSGEVGRNEWAFHEDGSFIACGFPRELQGPTQLYNIHGHSFAAAHFTAYLALLLEEHPEWTCRQLWAYVETLRSYE